MNDPMRPAIHWFRRDLRVADNRALHGAASTGRPVVPVFITSSWRKHHAWTGPNRQHFLCGCLASLARNLEALGGRLIVRSGEAVEELDRLIRESGAAELHFNLDPDPFGREVEARLRARCAELGVACHGHADVTLHAPDEVLTRAGQPYRVFTPYHRAWSALEKPSPVPKPESLSTPAGLESLPLPTPAHWGLSAPTTTLVEPGERAARQRMKDAVEHRIAGYDATRDLPAVDGTSRLSQDLRWGLVSIRTLHARASAVAAGLPPARRTGIETFLKELAWREFYIAILHHFPNVLDEEFNPEWRGLPWDEPGERFAAWQEGRTGFPIVDAGMRELLATGHMHNRLRMITAMFLTKDLHLDWKLGESWFLRHLVDGEIASNNGGWQWSAGTGADAAPYFRIQNPWSQTAKHDPTGAYIRRWVPELADVPTPLLLVPPKDGRPIAPGYVAPIVDHARERERTLSIFNRHRQRTH